MAYVGRKPADAALTSDDLEGKNSVVLMQAKNRMYIQQAILIYVLKK